MTVEVPSIHRMLTKEDFKRLEDAKSRELNDFLQDEKIEKLKNEDVDLYIDAMVWSRIHDSNSSRSNLQSEALIKVMENVPLKELKKYVGRIVSMKDFSKVGEALEAKGKEIRSWIEEQGNSKQGEFDPSKALNGKVEFIRNVTAIDIHEKPYYFLGTQKSPSIKKYWGATIKTPDGKKDAFIQDMEFISGSITKGKPLHEDLENIGCINVNGLLECKFIGKMTRFFMTPSLTLLPQVEKSLKDAGVKFIGYDEKKNAERSGYGMSGRELTKKDRCITQYGEPCFPIWEGNGIHITADTKKNEEITEVTFDVDYKEASTKAASSIFSSIGSTERDRLHFKEIKWRG